MPEVMGFSVGFACGFMAAIIGIILVLCTLRGSGGGRRNPPPPAHYKRPAPPPTPPRGQDYQSRRQCDHTGEKKLCTCQARTLLQQCEDRFNSKERGLPFDSHLPGPPAKRVGPPRKP